MGKSRDTGNLVSANNISVDIVNDRIGIGTTNPQESLEVQGNIKFGGGALDAVMRNWNVTSGDTDIDNLLPGSTSGIIIEGPDFAHLVMGIRDNDVNDGFSIISGSGNYQTDQTYDKLIAYFKSTGDVGIGTNNPVSELHVNGEITLGSSPFVRNIPTISSNYTVTSTYNEMSIGPITINTGITVTVNSGATWTIV